MAPSPTQHTGQRSETRTALWLEQQGLRVLDRNLRCRAGEIDLVALDGDVLVFVEVRYRSSASHGGAAASVNRGKQRRLLRAARYFLPSLARLHCGGRLPRCRFDVVCVQAGRLEWIRHAFAE
ncbi:MAG TPA: YraN family protein [Burkholderiaceae bacterium]|nr:YraN family protein [Burkholderiaceae bacterium]